ncbi:Uncharacterised protein [Budvicia aquatica]|uniref:Uncharacterized protein n=1 Tax=Budvicia aquatica TaxID=82979 RepID=A0A485A5Z2_9GAMM|nr:Uncharacterised protein [Budvicia aquatica]
MSLRAVAGEILKVSITFCDGDLPLSLHQLKNSVMALRFGHVGSGLCVNMIIR